MTGASPTADVPTYRVCGVPIAALDTERAAQLVLRHAAERSPLEVHLCNAYTLSLVDQDSHLRAALLRADLNLPDGTPVAWLGRGRGVNKPVRGPALLRAVARAGVESGLRHYFYGGVAGLAEELGVKLRTLEAGLAVAGAESPPFGDLLHSDIEAAAARIVGSEASLVWVGLGTPRQDYVVPLLSERVSIPVVPVGAAFDFLTGRVQEAPGMLHGSGLEWVYRLATEPQRLGRRYLFGNPRFVASAVRHRRSNA